MKLSRIRLWWWLVLVPIIFLFFLQLYFFVQIGWWKFRNPTSTSFMRQQLAAIQKVRPRAKLKHRWVSYNRISNNLKRAVITSEDATFAQHSGVDWGAISRALKKNVKKGKIIVGGSTVSQQLAKNLFLSGSRSYFRKMQEVVITFMLELWMTKRRILEIYLNVVEFGTGVFGAEAAARHYFNISASELSMQQAARLAVMLPRPRVYEKTPDSSYLAARTHFVLQHMNQAILP